MCSWSLRWASCICEPCPACPRACARCRWVSCGFRCPHFIVTGEAVALWKAPPRPRYEQQKPIYIVMDKQSPVFTESCAKHSSCEQG